MLRELEARCPGKFQAGQRAIAPGFGRINSNPINNLSKRRRFHSEKCPGDAEGNHVDVVSIADVEAFVFGAQAKAPDPELGTHAELLARGGLYARLQALHLVEDPAV